MQPSLPESDRVLVKDLKKGQLEAFDLLYERYCHKIYSFSRSILKTHEDAEGVVQEVFLRVWNKRNELLEHKSFKSFLFKLTYNVSIDHFRKRVKDHKYVNFVVNQAQQNCMDPLDILEYGDLKKEVETAINELPLKRKQVFQMSRLEGLSYNEIAIRKQISTKTVENHINLSLKHIRKRLCCNYDNFVL